MVYVVPKFTVIFEDMGTAIPFSTQVLMAMSHMTRNYWWVALVAVFLMGAAWFRFVATGKGRLRVDRIKLKTPIIGDLIAEAEVARFSRTLGTLMGSGVPILQGIELVAQILRNRAVSMTMQDLYRSVKEGGATGQTVIPGGGVPATGRANDHSGRRNRQDGRYAPACGRKLRKAA